MISPLVTKYVVLNRMSMNKDRAPKIEGIFTEEDFDRVGRLPNWDDVGGMPKWMNKSKNRQTSSTQG